MVNRVNDWYIGLKRKMAVGEENNFHYCIFGLY